MKLEESTIMAFLLGELNPAEEQAVREAIAEDEHWQEVVRDYEKLLTGFREERVNRYAAEVTETPPPPPVPSTTSGPWPWLLLLVVMAAAGYFLWPAPTSPEELAHEYFLLPNDPTVAGQNTAIDSYQDGLTAFFRERNYEEAVAAFSLIQEDTTWGTRAQFYLGHANFMVNNYAASERFLEQSLNRTDDFSRFELSDLAWNVLMARLAQGQDIKEELAALPQRDGQQELLEKLSE